ncbi:hypothetical protein ABGA94_02355, partial [Stenotrophomonas sp. 3diitr2024]
NQYDNPAWTPYLIAAFIGALFVFAGIILMLVQIYVSVRDRKRNLDLHLRRGGTGLFHQAGVALGTGFHLHDGLVHLCDAGMLVLRRTAD